MNFFGKAMNFLILNCLAAYGNHNRKRYISMSKKADFYNEKFLMKQLRCSKNTEYGKKYGFADIHSVSDFQNKVPLSTYDDYKPYVDRMVQTGEQGLLTGNKVDYFSKTSGTIKVMKMIPTVKGSYTHYIRSCSIILANLKTELKRKNRFIRYGRGMNLIESGGETTPSGIKTGYVSGYGMGRALAFAKYITCLPTEVLGCTEPIDMKYVKARYALQDGDLTYLMSVFMSALTDMIAYIIENHEILIDDIEKGVINSSVVMPKQIRSKLEKQLSPDPKRAEELRKVFSYGSNEGIIPKIWKNMALIIGIGAGEFAPFTQKMRYYAGKDIAFHYVIYAASEGMIATVINANEEDYMMLPDSGFFEFLPENDENAHPLLLNQLEAGKKYELIITNEAGLYRYCLKDVVAGKGLRGKPPLRRIAYRKEQVINLAGLHMTMEHTTETIRLLEKALHTNINDYSLYADNDHIPGRIVLFIETEDEISDESAEKLPQLFDSILAEVNVDYTHLQAECGDIAPSMVYVMKKGTYKEIREKKIQSGIAVNQIKSLRVIRSKEQFAEMVAKSEKIKNTVH